MSIFIITGIICLVGLVYTCLYLGPPKRSRCECPSCAWYVSEPPRHLCQRRLSIEWKLEPAEEIRRIYFSDWVKNAMAVIQTRMLREIDLVIIDDLLKAAEPETTTVGEVTRLISENTEIKKVVIH